MSQAVADGVYASSGTVGHEVVKHAIRKAKGGKIGTSGKGVVAWRVDHMIDEHRATTWPILRSRGMPCGVGLVTDAVGDPTNVADPTATTWAQARTMMWEGCEIWSHSATHLAPIPDGSSTGAPLGKTLEEEIAGSKAKIEANGMRVMGWQTPGIVGCLAPSYSGNIANLSHFNTPTGQKYLANYGLIEHGQQIPGGRPRFLPTDGVYGYAHSVTLESATVAQVKGWVDAAANQGVGVEIMFHPRYIGMPGQMSVADFTEIADYVKNRWDAGAIEVLTPSGLAFADPGSSFRLQMLRDTGFEGVGTSGAAIGAWSLNNATGITLRTDGGRTGTNYVRFSGTLNYAQQAYTSIISGGIQGAAAMVEAWVRNQSATPSVARIYVMDNSGNNPTFIRDVRTTLAAGQGWTRVRVPLVIPVTCANLLVRLSRFSTGSDGMTGDADFDDITLRLI